MDAVELTCNEVRKYGITFGEWGQYLYLVMCYNKFSHLTGKSCTDKYHKCLSRIS
jgi:hypothetical protein